MNLNQIPSYRLAQAKPALISSLALLGLIVSTIMSPPLSAKLVVAPKSMVMVSKPMQMAQCQGCHGRDFSGRKKFSPSLHASGVLKEYNKKTFERVMNTGITNDGTPVHQPMPVYHYKPVDSDKIYAYLKSLK